MILDAAQPFPLSRRRPLVCPPLLSIAARQPASTMLRADSPPPEGAWQVTRRGKHLIPPPSDRQLLLIGMMVMVASLVRMGAEAAASLQGGAR